MTGRLLPGTSATVEVPATSANLGPGFDCFGLALDWRDEVRVEVVEAGVTVRISGLGADSLPTDETHLVASSARYGLAELGVAAPGLRLTCANRIPQGRGLGSSSAAIVAGLLAAQQLAGVAADRSWLLRHATAIEGHPDNVAAAIYGGFVLAYEGQGGLTVAEGIVDPSLAVTVYVPAEAVATTLARSMLPAVVPHLEAAANAGRAALLVHALATDPSLLLDATADWLHQSYRQSAMPRSFQLLERLRADGFAAVISGAGPAVIVLGTAGELDRLADVAPDGFLARRVSLGSGARGRRFQPT